MDDIHPEPFDAWKYLCLHLVTDKLMAWIDAQFPLESAQSRLSQNVSFAWPLSEPITHQMVDLLHQCPIRFADLFLDRLAR